MIKPHLLSVFCLFVLTVSQPIISHAALITFDFTAEITRLGQVNSYGGTSVGDTFSGSFTFDSTVTDSPPGFYDFSGPPTGLTTQVGSAPVVLNNFRIRVFNDTPGGGTSDSYEVSGDTGSATTDTFFVFVFADSSGTVFSDLSLPLSPPSLADFDLIRGEVRQQQPSTLNPFSEFTVTSLTVSAIPVPAALWLFGSGMLVLLSVARRK